MQHQQLPYLRQLNDASAVLDAFSANSCRSLMTGRNCFAFLCFAVVLLAVRSCCAQRMAFDFVRLKQKVRTSVIVRTYLRT